MQYAAISETLKGKIPVGQTVTVKGWVRTRRDSKGGFSFVAVNDGSCFDSIQAVCANTLPNYTDDVTKLTAGCAVEITGKLVQSQGKGQSYEIQADAAGSRTPKPTPCSPSSTRWSICARWRTFGRGRTRLAR